MANKGFNPEKWKLWKWATPPVSYTCTDGNAGHCAGYLSESEQAFLEYTSADHSDLSGGAKCMACATLRGIPLDWDADVEFEETDNTICMGCDVEICNVCAVCHTEDCPFIERKILTVGMKSKYAFLTAKTQKVRGYVTLAEAGLNVPKPYRVIMGEGDVKDAVKAMQGKDRFIRPCPMRPRHGFVDSRPIVVTNGSEVEITELLNKAIAADEQGHAELLLVPYIQSVFNAIVTPTRVAIGPGHDGATGGHGSMSFPLAGVPFDVITPEILHKARIGENDDPYIEAVINKSRAVYFTQIRAGVKIAPTVGADFVPKPVRVVEVIDASGDLLEWEAQTRQIKEGTVVCHIGGTLISHYGVHCMQNDIPVFTSRRPIVGEVLEVLNKVAKPNPAAVVKGLGAGAILTLVLDGAGLHQSEELKIENALIAMMTILHNSAAMSEEDGFWLGVATSIMYRAGMAASHGEARHKINGMGSQRNKVYNLAFKNFFDGRETLGMAQYRFLNNSWTSGYGGKAWAKCTQAILDMDEVIQALIKDPSEANVAALVVNLNNAVNQAHNGGWWLNKFIIQQWFTKASKQNLESVVIGAATMFKIREMLEGKMGDAEAQVQLWGEAHPIVVTRGKLQIQKEYEKIGSFLKAEPEDIKEWESPYKSAKKPENPDYEGIYCELCGMMFTELGKEDIYGGMLCGQKTENGACIGLVGYYADGSFSFPLKPYNDDDSGDEENADSDEDNSEDFYEDPPCDCAACKIAAGGDPELSEAATDKQVPSPSLITGNTNMNTVPVPDEAKIISAQCQLGKYGSDQVGIHLQYKVDNQSGYHSCDAVLKYPDYKSSKAFQTSPSYSGSNKSNYISLDITPTPESYIWEVGIDGLKLSVYVNLHYNTLMETSKWEVKIDPKVETAEQTQKELEPIESPF